MDEIRREPHHGWIEVITGSMFSGKSEELIRRLRRAQIARQKVQIFKPLLDNRYSEDHIVSHSDMRIASQNVKTSDEPESTAEIEWEKCDAAGRRSIIVPAFHGRPGHPPLFRGSLFAELMGIGEETQGLKAVVRRNPARVMYLPWDDSRILLNLNTPLDLPSLEARRELR